MSWFDAPEDTRWRYEVTHDGAVGWMELQIIEHSDGTTRSLLSGVLPEANESSSQTIWWQVRDGEFHGWNADGGVLVPLGIKRGESWIAGGNGLDGFLEGRLLGLVNRKVPAGRYTGVLHYQLRPQVGSAMSLDVFVHPRVGVVEVSGINAFGKPMTLLLQSFERP